MGKPKVEAVQVRRGIGPMIWLKLLGVVFVAAVTVLWPVLTCTVIIGVMTAERRLIRQRWWWGWVGVTALIGVAAAGGPTAWATGALRSPASAWVQLSASAGETMTGWGVPAGWFTDMVMWSWPQIITAQLAFGVPIGLLVVALWDLARLPGRRQMGTIEGPLHSNVRPPGWLDRRRTRRTLHRVAAGEFSLPEPGGTGQSALGAGKYGHPVVIDRAALKKPTIITGSPRTGKTRQATSLASQEIRAGAGAIIIDYKGDPRLVQHYAALAHELGRTFLHFQLFDKSLSVYDQPHPYAPDSPAYYDPLSRGNGSSKSEMLLGSANRDGDAAAYLRAAQEVVQVAYDVAQLTGADRGKGGFDVIERMLDLEYLDLQAQSLTPDMVLRQFPSMPRQQATDRVDRARNNVARYVDAVKSNGPLRGAINDTKSWVSSFASSAAIGGQMQPGPPDRTIDLVRTMLRAEIVVFSLPVQDYAALAGNIGNMLLLDLTAAVSTLRGNKRAIGDLLGVDATQADATPWPPVVLQIEEFGSANNEVILGLMNKSSSEGIRIFLSTQSFADLEAVDGNGVWARRILDQVDNLFAFQGVDAAGSDRVMSEASGMVAKTRASTQIRLRMANILGFGRSAARAEESKTVRADEPRVVPGAVQALRPKYFEFIWVTKTPMLTATHTVLEGPNQWHEPIRFSGVHELPLDWTVERDMSADEIELARTDGAAARSALLDVAVNNPVVAAVLRGRDWDVPVTTQGLPVAGAHDWSPPVIGDPVGDRRGGGGGGEWPTTADALPVGAAASGADPAPAAAGPTPVGSLAPPPGRPEGLVRVPGRRRMVTHEPEPSPVIGPRVRGQALRRRNPATEAAAAEQTATTEPTPVPQLPANDDDDPSGGAAAAGPARRPSAAELLGIDDKPITFT